jgi:hypothetical protein
MSLPYPRAQAGKKFPVVRPDDGQAGIIVLSRGIGENHRLHAGHFSAASSGHGFKCSASEENRVELAEERGEINFRIHDDPVGFSLGAGNVAVQAHGDGKANFAQGAPVRAGNCAENAPAKQFWKAV